MNHCLVCGRHINTGLTCYKSTDNARCLICIQARILRDWHYDSPAMKRWRKQHGHGNRESAALISA